MLSYATADQAKEIITLLDKTTDRSTKTRQLLRLKNRTEETAQVAILALTAATRSN